MSRSERKNPYITDRNAGKPRKDGAKRRASRKVRDAEDEVPNGGAYRKYYCSWKICDWTYYDPKNRKAKKK